MAELKFLTISTFEYFDDFVPLSQIISDYGIVMSEQEVLDYEDNGVRILELYTEAEKQKYNNKPNANYIKLSPKLKIPLDKINREFIGLYNNLTVEEFRNSACFIDDQIRKIYLNKDFYPVERTVENTGQLYVKTNKIKVLLYSKSKQAIQNNEDIQSTLFELTPFVSNVSTSVTKSGGNFNLKIAFLEGTFNSVVGDVVINKDVYKTYASNAEQYVSVGTTHKEANLDNQKSDKYFVENPNNDQRKSYFKQSINFADFAIQQNDVIFISFEKLKLEVKRDNFDIFDTQSFKDLPNSYFDLIGLVDTVTTSTSMMGKANVTTTISGRDLMKVLIDDSEYFYPLEFFAGDGRSMFKYQDTQSLGNSVKRLIDGSFSTFAAFVDKTIQQALNFIFNNLTHATLTDNELFKYYDKTKLYKKIFEDENGNLVEEQVSGIWNFMQVVYDDSVKKRRLVDSSITTEQGSIMNFVHKVCQEPFVEFSGDTFGAKYFFIIRKLPFDFNGWTTNYVIDINEDLIYSQNLQFDTTSYSWYRLNPQGSYLGEGQNIALYDFPAVFFKEFADTFGNKPLDITTNYIDYVGFKDINESNNQLDYLREQCLADLRYLIESNAYLPFTRKGTILIKGDRRFKRGTLVRHKGTGELFHIDSVSNSYNVGDKVERTTTLEVSRGMVEAKLEWYFKIINFDEKIEEIVVPPARDENYNVNFHFDSGKWNLISEQEVANNPKPNVIPKVIDEGNKRIQQDIDNEMLSIVDIRSQYAQQNQTQLQNLTDYVVTQKPDFVIVTGHTDSDKLVVNNNILSQNRANTVINLVKIELRKRNFDFSKIVFTPQGKADTQRLNPFDNGDAIKKAENRRVEVTFKFNKRNQQQKPKKTVAYSVNRFLFKMFLMRKQFDVNYNFKP
jgi:outer membrane protein OmpA-like peptidoglycan-associated protein